MTAYRDYGSDFRTADRRWLCIAYAFPPINRSGTQRTLGFVRHLDRLGWNASVLTVHPTGEAIDPNLLAQVPEGTHVLHSGNPLILESLIRCRELARKSFRRRSTRLATSNDDGIASSQNSRSQSSKTVRNLLDWVSWFLSTPDSRIGWLLPGIFTGLRAIRRHRPEVIFSTSPYMTAHLIALVLSQLRSIPWVADFRDPWRSNPFREVHHESINRWDAWLESLVLRHANHITCTSPTTADLLIGRCTSVMSKCTTILNGFDVAAFRGVRPIRELANDKFVITHAGEFYGKRTPHALFAAVRELLMNKPEFARKLVVSLIGSDSFGGCSLQKLACEFGIQPGVQILGRRTHTETLARLAGSDAVALVGASGAGSELQIPAKLFEYLALRRPILALSSARNPTSEILRQAQAMAEVCEPDDVPAVTRSIEQLMTRRHSAIGGAWSGVDAFERSHRAAELAGIFEDVAAAKQTKVAHASRKQGHFIRSASALRKWIINRRLETMNDERIGGPLAADGGLRAVTGEDSRRVGERH